jgi:hypothetical protein
MKMEVRKRFEDGLLVFYCGVCGEVLYTTEDLDYAGTNACEVWEVELWDRHKRQCPELIKAAKKRAEIARSFGHTDARWQDLM